MHTKNSLIKDITSLKINKTGTLLIHSSMKAIGEVEGRADTVLDAFSEYMKDGLLLFPTHSWGDNNLKDGLYDYKVEASCVGILPNLFMKREGVFRSLHPTHSVTGLGVRAEEYAKKDDDVHSPCPRQGCFGSLYDENAEILFLGSTLKTNTFIHSVEEWLDIENRVATIPVKYRVVQRDGSMKEIDFYRHHSTLGDVSQNYDKLEKVMIQKGIAKKQKIGDAVCFLVKVKPMADMVVRLLKKNRDLFSDNALIPEEWYSGL